MNEASPSLLTTLLSAQFSIQTQQNIYQKAQNLGRILRDKYNSALSDYDALILPTCVTKATSLAPPDASIETSVKKAFEPTAHTMPFNVTGMVVVVVVQVCDCL